MLGARARLAAAVEILLLAAAAPVAAEAGSHWQQRYAYRPQPPPHQQQPRLSVTVEYAASPLALQQLAPRFSWVIPTEGSQRGEMQTSYKIAIARSEDALAPALALAAPVASNRSVLMCCEGKIHRVGKLNGP